MNGTLKLESVNISYHFIPFIYDSIYSNRENTHIKASYTFYFTNIDCDRDIIQQYCRTIWSELLRSNACTVAAPSNKETNKIVYSFWFPNWANNIWHLNILVAQSLSLVTRSQQAFANLSNHKVPSSKPFDAMALMSFSKAFNPHCYSLYPWVLCKLVVFLFTGQAVLRIII